MDKPASGYTTYRFFYCEVEEEDYMFGFALFPPRKLLFKKIKRFLFCCEIYKFARIDLINQF